MKFTLLFTNKFSFKIPLFTILAEISSIAVLLGAQINIFPSLFNKNKLIKPKIV